MSSLFSAITNTTASSEDGVVLVCYSFLSALAVLLVTRWGWNYYSLAQTRARYDAWIRRARHERDSKGHRVLNESLLSQDETLYSASDTRDLVVKGKLDPRENVVRLAQRCRRYGRPRNVIAEELYEEAAEAAESLSKNASSSQSPLYGVPISVKECLSVKGCYSTGGLACRLGQRKTHDSLLVQVLKSQGALPLCTGNVMQIMMLPECVNRIWGRAENPWDYSRTPGGSSGGDAALVALGCVPLALASDVAGSIRIPASFCGVVGFKPCSRRLSGKGNMKPRKDDKAGTAVIIPTVRCRFCRDPWRCVSVLSLIVSFVSFTEHWPNCENCRGLCGFYACDARASHV
jgi:hypothetical protein